MALADLYPVLRAQVSRIIVGQDAVFEQVMVALLAGGHVLLEGVPGTAKTLLAKTLARLIDAPYGRIQFTADLMPSDVVGTQVFNLGQSTFTLKKGPIFAGILLADEVNRAPAKTQSALLEAMEERQVTIEGERHLLPPPFMVLATQNPIDFEGTYPLPEASLDRFMFKVRIDYPGEAVEQEILRRYHVGFDAHNLDAAGLHPVLDPTALRAIREEVRAVAVEESILAYITRIVASTRRSADLLLGAGPRAGITILLAAKALAALSGRDFTTPDDVKQVALPALRHRLILRPEAEIEGFDADAIVRRILASIEVPR